MQPRYLTPCWSLDSSNIWKLKMKLIEGRKLSSRLFPITLMFIHFERSDSAECFQVALSCESSLWRNRLACSAVNWKLVAQAPHEFELKKCSLLGLHVMGLFPSFSIISSPNTASTEIKRQFPMKILSQSKNKEQRKLQHRNRRFGPPGLHRQCCPT